MPSTPTTDHNWSARLWWTLVGVMLLGRAFQIVNYAPNFGWAAWAAIGSGFWGLATVIVSWIPQAATLRARSRANVFAWITAIMTLLAFAAWAAIQVHIAPAYGTDELAFDQYAATLVQHGLNPYTHSMGPAFPMFGVSPGGYTFTLTGAKVTALSYPSLSFLLYVPFLLLGWSNQLGVGMDVLGWSIATLLIFKFLPRPLRPAVLLLSSALTYTQLSIIGLTDMLFMPMLVIAAYHWDRFGRDWRSYIGPVAFGLAMAVKQTPWPILPFLLLALAIDESTRTNLTEGARRAGRYLIAVVIAFVIPNIPYIVAAPSAWVRGTFTPIFKSLVPAGQGAIGFSLFLHAGGGSLQAYTLLFVLVFVLLLVSYVGMYPLLRAATFALPAVAYFFAVRSYAAYLVALVPPGMVAAVTADAFPMRPTGSMFRSRGWKLAISGVAAACVLAALHAGTAGSPLSVQISQVDANGAANVGGEMTLRVTNHTSSTQRPYFTLETQVGVSSFWHISGSKLIKPGVTRYFVISSPDQASQFSVNNGITVLAFLTHPASVSVSNHYQPALWHLGFRPESDDALIPLCKPLRLRVQLLNDWDTPIDKTDVPIWISQSVFGSDSRLASIDGEPIGDGAEIFTNSNGVASFSLVGERNDFYSLTLNASVDEVNGVDGYDSDSSQPLLLRFGSPKSPGQQCVTS
jgi:uncharacterized membrane protein